MLSFGVHYYRKVVVRHQSALDTHIHTRARVTRSVAQYSVVTHRAQACAATEA